MSNVNSILVVDADRSARSGLARLLRTAGYAVCEFASADEFQHALAREIPGCVVLDAGRCGPPSEGLWTNSLTRDATPPIIVVAIDDDAEIKRRAQQMNAVGFFRKPVDGTALLDAIDWVLRSNPLDNKRT